VCLCYQIKKNKCSYFKSVWNILDILVILITILCVAFNVYRTLKVNMHEHSVVLKFQYSGIAVLVTFLTMFR